MVNYTVHEILSEIKVCEERCNVMGKELRCNKEMDVLNNCLQY